MKPDETIGRMPDYYFPPYITLAHMFSAPKGWAIHDRVMRQFVLQYVVDGAARYPVENRDYETVRGDLLFHRPLERHSIVTVEDKPYVCISIVFHFGNAAFPYDDLFRGAHLLGNYSEHPVAEMLSQLVSHYRQPGLVHQMQCQSLLMRILAETTPWNESLHDGQTGMTVKQMPKLVLIKNYLYEHYQRRVTIQELEAVSGLSKNYILLLFRKHVGMPPIQYLTWIRINKAKEMAVQTNLSVSEIAERVGYTDVHTFGRMFKNKTGQSLTQFCSNLIYS
jgi:AraC-like DNA-binding protein